MKKDQNEFKKLYDQYFRYVYFIVAQSISRQEDRDEIVSDVFIDVWKLLESIDEDQNVKALIYTITKRRIHDFLRKLYRLQEHELPVIQDFEYVEQSEENQKVDRKESNVVKNLIQHLDAKYQTLYQLKYVESVSSAQIAIEMGISKNYVKVLNNRLIKQIKTLWETQNSTTT